MIGPSSFCGVSTCAACRKLIWLIFTSPRCRWHRTRPVWYGPRICRWVGLWIFGLQSWIHEIPTKETQQHKFFWRMNSWFCNIRICLKWKVAHPNWNPGPLTTELREWDIFPTHHDDVIKWKPFPRYWPFVLGIQRSPVNSRTKASDARSFVVFFDLHPNKRLSKQWWGCWFETPSCPLWRHRNVI